MKKLILILFLGLTFVCNANPLEYSTKVESESQLVESYGLIVNGLTLDNFREKFSPNTVLEDCEVEWDITITDAEGNTTTSKGSLKFKGVSCTELFEVIIPAIIQAL